MCVCVCVQNTKNLLWVLLGLAYVLLTDGKIMDSCFDIWQ